MVTINQLEEKSKGMKKLIASVIAIATAGSLAFAAGAGAMPTAVASLDLKPSGTIYKEALKPAKLSLDATVTPEPGATTMNPMIELKINQMDKMAFVPNNKKTPVCTTITATDTNYPTEEAIRRCPNSILGDGTADLYLAQQVGALVTDSVLVAFNGGKDNQGNPQLVVHGYSASLNTGIYINALQKNGTLTMSIPRLSADSSVPRFGLEIPGDMGKDSSYVQAACPTSTWWSNSVVTVAKSVEGKNISDRTNITTAPYTQACTGKAGKGKLKVSKVKAKGKVKANKKGKFKVTVKNSGTATAKKIKLTGKGAGKGKSTVGNLAPGKSKTYNLKLKVKGKKGKKVTVKVKAQGKNTNASTGKTKVKLK
jgi:hypothetical protein